MIHAIDLNLFRQNPYREIQKTSSDGQECGYNFFNP